MDAIDHRFVRMVSDRKTYLVSLLYSKDVCSDVSILCNKPMIKAQELRGPEVSIDSILNHQQQRRTSTIKRDLVPG